MTVTIVNTIIGEEALTTQITDIVRISDARMSGTAFGTVFLHASPESAVGGPLAFVQNGDFIAIDVLNKNITLEISDEEMEERRKNWKPIDLGYVRGYAKLYIENVNQAHEGADFDFLVGNSGSEVKRESH